MEKRETMSLKLDNAGFSIKELVAVMAIILILISVISAFFLRYIEKTNEQTDVYNMKMVQREAEASFLIGHMEPDVEYYYDESSNGIASIEPESGYGRGTSRKAGIYYTNYLPEMDVVGEFLCAKASVNGVEVYWYNYKPFKNEEEAE